MSRKSSFTLMSFPLFLMACVTINIYFPAAAAEKAADRIIEDVWGKEGEQPAPEAKPEESSAVQPQSGQSHNVAIAVLDFFIPAAQAADADISISTPAIDRLRGSMRKRHGKLKGSYKSGAIGLTRDALIKIRDRKAVPLKQRNSLKQLVADENRDRNGLYRAIADANGHPEWEREIRATFAKRWVGKARGGWWYQDRSGGWVQK